MVVAVVNYGEPIRKYRSTRKGKNMSFNQLRLHGWRLSANRRAKKASMVEDGAAYLLFEGKLSMTYVQVLC